MLRAAFCGLALAVAAALPSLGDESAVAKYGAKAEAHALTRAGFQADHISRVDSRRLVAIAHGLDQLEEMSVAGGPGGALKGLAGIEASLFGLRLSTADIDGVRKRIECLRASLEGGGYIAPCAALAEQESVSAGPVDDWLSVEAESAGLAQSRLAAGVRLTDDGREPFVVAFYGPAVDRDIGELFARLGTADPALLQPIPMDRDYQQASCINLGREPVVASDPTLADDALRAMLNSAERLYEEDEVFRFTLVQSRLREMQTRTGLAVPARLADFTVQDALRLIASDFVARFGMVAVDPEVVPAFRNLWIQLHDETFLHVIEEATGRHSISPQEVGDALAATELDPRSLWERALSSAAVVLHCNDANKVFEAYGLYYRGAHYPTARLVLNVLRKGLGYDAVPGVSLSQTSHSFLEATNNQSCALYGPVEQAAGGTSREECKIRELTVDGQLRYEVMAGGAAIQFFLTDDQRQEILAAVRELARDREREGDILRWRSTAPVPVQSQAIQTFVAQPDDLISAENVMPCIVSLSQSREFDSPAHLKRYVEDYRKHFYLGGEPLSPEYLSYLFVFDRYGGHRNKRFRENMAAVIESLTESYRNMIELIETAGEEGAVGAAQLPPSAIRPICDALVNQISALSRGNDVSHGEFIRSLLIGRSSAIGEGVGILNPTGEFLASDFDLQVDFRATENDMNTVVEEIIGAHTIVDQTQEVNESGAPLGVSVFNLSLGSSYKDAEPDLKRNAQDALKNLRAEIAKWDEDGLFIVAAGQPAGAAEGAEGIRLSLVPAGDASVDDPDCHFFPACLSQRNNVVTVGAVQPSATLVGYELPVLIEWANYGPAVTVAGPGVGVLSNEFGYISEDENGAQLKLIPTTSVRDGTSVATVFVTAIAVRMAAEFPDLLASEIKKRLIATSRPYVLPEENKQQFFAGSDGKLLAGVIDPFAALLNPYKTYVAWKHPPEGVPKLEEFSHMEGPDDRYSDDRNKLAKITIFTRDHERGQVRLKCRWSDLLRLHIEGDFRETEDGAPLFRGAMACEGASSERPINVASGPFGTKVSHQQHDCITNGDCFKAIRNGETIFIDLAEVTDIYFPVIK